MVMAVFVFFPALPMRSTVHLALQKELKNEPAVPLRIGLHIGEVFFEDAKALGDGVNVASRVSHLARKILSCFQVRSMIK
jgi:class 3 adenylate cyclase